MFEWHTELLDPDGLGFLVMKDSSHFISRFCFFFSFLGIYRYEMAMFDLQCSCHCWFFFFLAMFDDRLMRSRSIRGRRVDLWQKRCHRHWLWLWMSENSGNWWVLIRSDIYIYIYTYHTIPLPYLTLHYIHIVHTHTHTHSAIGWIACVIFTEKIAR